MIIVDNALKQREASGRPIRVGMIGAGFMGRGVALQIATAAKGMRLVAIANRHVEGACSAYIEAGQTSVRHVISRKALSAAIQLEIPAVTEDWSLLCQAEEIDVILEVTGAIDYAACAVAMAIDHGKHAILMNAELDGTIGALFKRRADAAGVIYTNVDGDQPGVTMNLYRFVVGLGVRPVLCGNIKGLHDPYRNPTTQIPFARKWQQKPHMVASFADGTKMSFEQAIVANATGMRVGRRGMFGPTVPDGTPLHEAVKLLPVERYMEGPGIVDYLVGAVPAPGVFVVGTIEQPQQRHYLNLYKLGEGPHYLFYTPYHLCHFEVPNTIARAALFGDATIAPKGAPTVEVVATAKRALKAGETIDEIGYYMTYGQCENAEVVFRDRLLPMGLAAGCRVRRDLDQDAVLTYNDVELPAGRLVDIFRAEQDSLYASTYAPGADRLAAEAPLPRRPAHA
jgi:predicted homoserine dehydrogenase-like protein